MSSPVWELGIAERHLVDKKDPFAICKCPVDKQDVTKTCNKKVGLSRGSTSSLRYHIKKQHPTSWAKLIQAEKEKTERRQQDIRELEEIHQDIEVESDTQLSESSVSKKRTLNDTQEDFHTSKRPKLLTSTPKSSKGQIPLVFQKKVKCNIRDKRQLQFDLDLMKMMVMTNQSFELVNDKYFIEYNEKLAPHLHTKTSRTFARNKLPLLYLNVKKAVDAKLSIDLPKCKGVGFTGDFWSSRGRFHQTFSPSEKLPGHSVWRKIRHSI
jgi:hypothetical protein